MSQNGREIEETKPANYPDSWQAALDKLEVIPAWARETLDWLREDMPAATHQEEPGLEQLLEQFQSDSALARLDALEKLRPYYTDQRVFEALLKCLEDKWPADSDQCGWDERGDEQWVDNDCALNAVANVLCIIADEHAIESLVTILQKKNSSYAARVLAVIANERVFEPLVAILQSKSASLPHAARILARLGDKRALGPLIEALQEGFLDKEVVEALVKLAGPDAVLPLIQALPQAIQQGTSRLSSSPLYPIVRALDNLGDRRAFEPLIWALPLLDSAHGFEMVANTLAKLGDTRAVEPLIPYLQGNDYQRKYAAYALEKVGDPRAIEPLIACLRHSDSGIRSHIIYVLGELMAAQAIEPLISCLQDSSSAVRVTAIEALKKLEATQAIEPLISCLQEDPSIAVRTEAAALLGRWGAVQAIEPLIAYLHVQQLNEKQGRITDEAGRLRAVAARSLEKLGAVQAIEPLITCLQDRDD